MGLTVEALPMNTAMQGYTHTHTLTQTFDSCSLRAFDFYTAFLLSLSCPASSFSCGTTGGKKITTPLTEIILTPGRCEERRMKKKLQRCRGGRTAEGDHEGGRGRQRGWRRGRKRFERNCSTGLLTSPNMACILKK